MRDSNHDSQPGPDAIEFSCLPRQGCLDIPIIPWAIIYEWTERGQLSSEQELILQYESLGGAIGRCRGDSPLTREDFREVFENHPWIADMLNDPWIREATVRYLEESVYASFPNSVETLSWENTLGPDQESEPPSPNDDESSQVEDSQPESTSVEPEESTDSHPTEPTEDISEVEEEVAEDTPSPNDDESSQVEDSQPESTSVEPEESTDSHPTEPTEDISEVEEEVAEDTPSPNDDESSQVEDSQPESTSVEPEKSTDSHPTEPTEDISEVEEEVAEDTPSPNDDESSQVEDSQPESTSVEPEKSTDSHPTEPTEDISEVEEEVAEDTDSSEAMVEVTPMRPPMESSSDHSFPELIGGVTATALALGALATYLRRKRAKKI